TRIVESQEMTDTVSGTAPYMAPEVWRRQISPHSDQYSLAVTYAELRLGRRPFTGTDMYSLMMAHVEGQPNLDTLPDAEQQVLRKALAKDPAERYSTCSQFAGALVIAATSIGQLEFGALPRETWFDDKDFDEEGIDDEGIDDEDFDEEGIDD